VDVDPMLIKKVFDEDLDNKALIAGVTTLPEYISCEVDRTNNVIVLTNDEPVLGGRPLIYGPVYEFFLQNATNAQETPEDGLNLFKFMAYTLIDEGVEEFAAEGWTIYPELLETAVETSNPGFGLYTNFTFTFQTISLVPAGGSIRIVGPEDYYFGPLIEPVGYEYDPLESEPPPQIALEEDRPVGEVDGCAVLRTSSWACPFEILSCLEQERLEELKSIGVSLTTAQSVSLTLNTADCEDETADCETAALSNLVTCTSEANELVINLADTVQIPKQRTMQLLIQGYNTRYSMAPRSSNSAGVLSLCTDCDANTWLMQTRDSDTEMTVLDSKAGIAGLSLVGVVSVLSIIPSDTKVDSIENYVVITLRLDVDVDPEGTLKITHPSEFIKSENAAYTGSAVSTGSNFPRLKEIRQSLNVIEIIAIEETILADEDITVTILMSNPGITPSRTINIWTFEAYSSSTGSEVIENVNYNVSGFKIFGEFSRGAILPTVLSPSSTSVICVWFNLKSVLPIVDQADLDPDEPQGLPKALRIWLPKGFLPDPAPKAPLYEFEYCSDDFSLSYEPSREGVDSFSSTIDFLDLPSDSHCENHYDQDYGQYYIYIYIDPKSILNNGMDYAFEFGAVNPSLEDMPSAEDNVWRMDTVMSNVILHLKKEVEGYDLEQIKIVNLNYEDTTKLKTMNALTFEIMSEKYISGGSKVRITGPTTFKVGCTYFRVVSGLSSTTTCLVKDLNIVEFTLDSQDPKDAETLFSIRVMWTNPEFTPQENWWRVDIVNALGEAIDVRDYIQGFDITDEIEVYVHPTFAYLGETNPLEVIFVAQTIMNQADSGNELVVVAPEGYVFPENCSGFYLRLTDSSSVDTSSSSSSSGYPSGYTFPPDGTTCTGFDNESVVVRLPDGSGLLKNNYTLEIEVENPGYQPNSTDTWQMFTRVRNENGTTIVDANRSIPSFTLSELAAVRTDEGAASRTAAETLQITVLLLLLPCLATRPTVFGR